MTKRARATTGPAANDRAGPATNRRPGPVTASAPAVQRTRAAAVLALQRQAGNQAVIQLMRPQPVRQPAQPARQRAQRPALGQPTTRQLATRQPASEQPASVQPASRQPAPPHAAAGRPAAVQRFVGYEHEALGNVTGADVDLGGGVVLSWGQVVALAGDEFGTVDDLRAAAGTEAGRRRIRAALEHDGVRGPIPASLPAATEADRSRQSGTFIELAMSNASHFAEGGNALGTWRSHHLRALHEAMDAGLAGTDGPFQQAQGTEAFGQHFLTDLFSGGHARVPRQLIIDFYAERSGVMAERFVANLRARLEAGLVSQVMLQMAPIMRGSYTQARAREKVHAAVGAKLDQGLARIGGQAGLARYFGLALAGAVSGALHDRDGRHGVVVASTAHPQPWLAKGDAMLADSPVSRDQAESAVLRGREQLLAARQIGASEAALDRAVPADPPAAVHFGFDSAALDPAAAAAVRAAGAWLHAHPNDSVELIGRTDPLGTPGYNVELGRRRAQSVRSGVEAAGAAAGQALATSQGEAGVATVGRARYGELRRVDFAWRSGVPAAPGPAGGAAADPRRTRALATLAALGPPFTAVEQHVPRPVDGMNEPLPEWRWGSMSPEVVAELDVWVRAQVGPHVPRALAAVDETITEGDYTLAPRQLVAAVLNELMGAPARTLGNLIGQQPG